MSREAADTHDRDISTAAEFDLALQSRLRSALEDALDLRGAWEYRNGQASPELAVLVTELATSK